MSLNFTFNITDPSSNQSNQITKDMTFTLPSAVLGSFINSQFPFSTKPPLNSNASYFSDWGGDIFDSYGFFYLYDENQNFLNLNLTDTDNSSIGTSVTNTFTMGGTTYYVKHGYPTHRCYMFDISSNDSNKSFGFGKYGNMGSDNLTVNTDLSSNIYNVDGNDISFQYNYNYQSGSSTEKLYSYFFPYDVSMNLNSKKNYVKSINNIQFLSLYSVLVKRGLTVIMAKFNDIVEYLMDDAGYTEINYLSVDDALQQTLANQSNKSTYKNFLKSTVYNLFNDNRLHTINYSNISNLLNQTKYNTFTRNLKYVLINTNDITNLTTIDLRSQWNADTDFYIPGDINDKIKIQIGDDTNNDIYYLTFNGSGSNVLSIDISNNLFGSSNINNINENSTFGDITVSMIGGGGITQNNDVSCLTNSCDVLTPNGYIPIYQLHKGDLILNSNNQIRKIKNIYRKIFKITDNNKPFLIKKNTFGINIPIKDTYLSPKHAILFNDKWNFSNQISNIQLWNKKSICYYNIQLNDYFNDNLIVNGLIVESWDGNHTHSKRNYYWKKYNHYYIRKLLN